MVDPVIVWESLSWVHVISTFFPSLLLNPPDPENLGRKSGTKKEPKPKLLSPDIFWWGGGLPREGVGAKKFGMSLETQGIKLFWRDIPGFCRDIPEAPEKFEKKNVWVQFLAPRKTTPGKLHLHLNCFRKKGSFQKSPFSRDSREFRDSRDFRESPDSGK